METHKYIHVWLGCKSRLAFPSRIFVVNIIQVIQQNTFPEIANVLGTVRYSIISSWFLIFPGKGARAMWRQENPSYIRDWSNKNKTIVFINKSYNTLSGNCGYGCKITCVYCSIDL